MYEKRNGSVSFLEVNAALDESSKVKLLKQDVTEKVADVTVKLRQSARLAEKEKEKTQTGGDEEFLTPTRPARKKHAGNCFLAQLISCAITDHYLRRDCHCRQQRWWYWCQHQRRHCRQKLTSRSVPI